MTVAPNLPVRRPPTLDGEAVTISEQFYTSNPHDLPVGASALLTAAAAVGTFWSVWHGYDNAGLAFVALLVMLFATVALLIHRNASQGASR